MGATVEPTLHEETRMLRDEPVAALAVDETACVVNMNAEARGLLNRDLEQIRGIPVHEAIEDPGLRMLVIYALLHSPPIEGAVCLQDGREITLSVSTVPVSDGRAAAVVLLRETRPEKTRPVVCS
ncbi:MAG: PAS domain-containing protein [Candidatus Brocadiia bacterium]